MNAHLIDRLLEQAVADRVFPGVVAVAGDRDGPVYEGCYGKMSVDGQEPVRPDTVMHLASVTKSITSVAALQLIERGSLELEQPVASVLPAFGELDVLDGFDGDVPRLRRPARQATIRNLLTHTSGLSYWFDNADALRYQEIAQIPNRLSGLRSVFEMPLTADPGTRWEYGMSTDWLGQLIEAVSEQDLADYCDEHIFGPLGMVDTTFDPTDEQRARMMALHDRTPSGDLVISSIELPEHPEYWSGGDGAYGTAADHLRFMRALLRGGELDGERVLRPETVELAFTDHLDALRFPAVMWHSEIPQLSNDVPALPVAQGWGLAFRIVLEDLPGMRHSGTGDWGGLFNCYYWIDRAASIAGALFTQVLPFLDTRIIEQLAGFEMAVYAGLGASATASDAG